MKILLVNPPWYGDNWHGVRAGCRWPFIFNAPKPPENSYNGYCTYPFFMGFATTYLAEIVRVGDVFFYDALARKHNYDTFYKNVDELKPDITIIETSTPSIENDLLVAKTIKERCGAEIALCGTHATVYAEDMIKYPFVDYVLKGEYEVNSYEMCLSRKKGIYESRPLKNIDVVGMPFRDQSSLYCADGFGHADKIQFPQLQVWTSRGCPYNCNFCLWRYTMTCGNYRRRSLKNIGREITLCIKELGIRSVLLDDDTMNVGDEWTKSVSRMMDNISVEWHAMVRADSCSWDAFEEMRRCGCLGLKLGIESFSQRGLDYVNKGYKKDKLIKTLNFLVSCGFKLYISLMDNIPTETEEDKLETAYWTKHFIDCGVQIQHPNCMPLPGTKLFNNLEMDTSDWRKFGIFNSSVIK